MTLIMPRRELLATAALASASMALPSPAACYGNYGTNRSMRAPTRKDGESISQWLVLLIDASSSMRNRFTQMSFYDIQIEATARALMEPCVVDRLIGPPSGRTAIGAVLWSANMQQEIIVQWSVIRSIEDIAAVAARLRTAANYLDSYTGVAAAVRFAIEQLKAVYIPDTSRKIINMMANGRDNLGGKPWEAAREAEDCGIAINAVVMKGYDGTVEDMYQYYSDNVITRDGLVFKVESEDEGLEALAVANASKFCAEIAAAPASAGLPA
jgi:Ca-activated chloride channel homolog